jgi:hypothetical protein
VTVAGESAADDWAGAVGVAAVARLGMKKRTRTGTT